MAEVVNALWIGDALGLMERLALTSFLRQGHEVHLYCYDQVAHVPEGTMVKDANEILPASAIFRYEQGPGKGSMAAFADLFRYKLLLEKGGWWVDCDVVCLKPFDFRETVVIAAEHTQASVQAASAIMRLPPGHVVIQRCYERASQRDCRTLQWGEIGPRLLTEVVARQGLARFVKGVSVFCPLPWWAWRLLLCEDAGLCVAFLTEHTHAIHLWHEMWREAGVDRQTAFPATSLYSQLLKSHAIDPPA